MKKTICALLALCLCAVLCVFACAEDAARQKRELPLNGRADFDFDGAEEDYCLTFNLDEYEDGSFTLTVGGSEVTVENCVCLEKALTAVNTGYASYFYGTLFMVSEYGPSDDPVTYCLLYTEGELMNAGEIPALAKYIEIAADGLMTTDIRADMIGTWSRPADYMLVNGLYASGDEWVNVYRVLEIPRTLYPMGMTVTTKIALALSESVYDMEGSVNVPAGTELFLTATDDVSRLYAQDATGEYKGWLAIKKIDCTDCVKAGGVFADADEVFDGIFYAD